MAEQGQGQETRQERHARRKAARREERKAAKRAEEGAQQPDAATEKSVHPGLKAVLEFGPIVGFFIAYILYKDEVFVVGGVEYTGFVAVTAAFIPIFLLGIGVLWFLTGRLARMQAVTAVLLIVFGGLSVWFNDPRFFKMKPTAVYMLFTIILGIGLLRGQSWLKFVMEEMMPLKDKGWMILTKRVTLLFFLSAVANEVVWRTQSEEFWVYFETFAMPVVIFVFFMAQSRLFATYATMNPSKK
ncbi:MAG: inner membrane-spanning protein YciB [Pseudomonadota bacterium]